MGNILRAWRTMGAAEPIQSEQKHNVTVLWAQRASKLYYTPMFAKVNTLFT